MLSRLAHVIARRRKAVIAVWLVLTLFGGFSAQQVSKRWFQSFSIPGYSAYEANVRTLHRGSAPDLADVAAALGVEGGEVLTLEAREDLALRA